MASQPFNVALQDGIVAVKFKEGAEIPPECIMEVIAQMNQLCDLNQYNAIFDGRGAHPSDNFGYNAMERIVNFIDNNPEFQWNPQLAILVDAGVLYGLSRMFQTLTDHFPVDIQIFSDKAEAMAWIKDKKTAGDPAA